MPLGKTPILQNDLMAQNDNNKYLLYNDSIVRIEDSIQRSTTTAVGALTNITLTELQFLGFGVQIFTSATNPFTVTVPTQVGSPLVTTNRIFSVINNSGQNLTITHGGGGSTVVLPTAEGVTVYADGTNIIAIAGAGVSPNNVAVTLDTTTIVGATTDLSFASANFNVTNPSGSRALVTLASGVGNTPLQNAGVQVVAAPTALNITGNGATASDVGGVGTINVPGTTIRADSGTPVPNTTTPPTDINFIAGTNMTIALVDNLNGTVNMTLTAAGGGVGAVPVQKDGVQVVAAPTALNFTGTNIAVTDVGGVATIAVTPVSEASVAQIRTGTAAVYVSPANMDSALAFVTLTDAANIAWDMGTGINFNVILGGSRTVSAPTNVKPGRSGVIEIVQDGAGSRTLTWNSVYKFAGGTAPTLSTNANARDTFTWFARTSSEIYIATAGTFA